MNNCHKSLFENEIFNRSRMEIESLGFSISDKPSPGAQAYAVIGGRSNTRWWLIPLGNRHIAQSGLSMFQPILFSARALKSMAATLSYFGLSACWARNRLYVSGKSYLEDIFKHSDLQYAFFTGTDSPHRKSAIQVMDDIGRIKGYAKITQNALVRPLLLHEAKTIQYLQNFKLESAILPTIQYCDYVKDSFVLATDTLKSSHTKTVNSLGNVHLEFLKEIADKTIIYQSVKMSSDSDKLASKFKLFSNSLSIDWHNRIDKAINIVADFELYCTSKSLSHGDFTPSNTFIVKDKLYVFDWEYAGFEYSPYYDLIHFLLSSYRYKMNSDTQGILHKIHSNLNRLCEPKSIKAFLLIYLLQNVFFYFQRDLMDGSDKFAPESYSLMAELIDAACLSATKHE